MRFKIALLLFFVITPGLAEVLLRQDFEGDSLPGWSDSGRGSWQLTTYAGNTAIRLTRQKAVTLSLSTVGFTGVSISMQLAGGDLERSDRCLAQASVDGGKNWLTVVEVTPAMADGVTLYTGRLAIAELSENPQLRLRFKAAGNDNNDYCWGDNVRVSRQLNSAATSTFDSAFLYSKQRLLKPRTMAAFAKPVGATGYLKVGSGRLQLQAAPADGFDIVLDRFDYQHSEGDSLAVFPEAILEWVQSDGFVIPVDQSVQRLAHPNWEIAFQVGRVWAMPGQPEELRYSVPFALVERNASCTHNGVMTWAVNHTGQASRVAYQIASETCAYLKFNLWGTLATTFSLAPKNVAPAVVTSFEHNRQRWLPVSQLTAITEQGADINAANFSAVAAMDPADTTVSGLVLDGRHYRSDCPTRYGLYPFCNEILLPSFSIAKSIFAGLALMRLELIDPGAGQTPVAALIPQCQQAGWGPVTIEHALDMATGRYLETAAEVDEGSPEHVAFLYADTHDEKIDFACHFFPKKSAPGQRWVYHSSDTYIAGAAMRARLEKDATDGPVDIYNKLIVEPLWRPLELGAALQSTRTTYDASAHAVAGWGLSLQPDDIARIGVWLHSDALLSGDGPLAPKLLAAALQRDPEDRGLVAGAPNVRYNNGFWGIDIAEFIACDKPVWVPFMSGHGGISVVLFPNDTVFYHFSDGYHYRWREAAIESNKIRNMCP